MTIALKAKLDIDENKIDIKFFFSDKKFPLFDPLTSFDLSDLKIGLFKVFFF